MLEVTQSIGEQGVQPRQSAETSRPTTVPSSTQASVPLLFRDDVHHRIVARAYERYELRGCGDGHALEDWLSAERQILEERAP